MDGIVYCKGKEKTCKHQTNLQKRCISPPNLPKKEIKRNTI